MDTTILKKLSRLQFHLEVLLGSTLMDVNSLLNLKKGDIIKLDQKLSEPFRLSLKNQKEITGWPGSYQDFKAIEIKDHNV